MAGDVSGIALGQAFEQNGCFPRAEVGGGLGAAHFILVEKSQSCLGDVPGHPRRLGNIFRAFLFVDFGGPRKKAAPEGFQRTFVQDGASSL